MGGRTNQFKRSVLHPAWDKQMFLTPGPTVARLMKGYVDPIANQYVPNMQCPLQLLMKKQAGWFIVPMLEEAKHCCCAIKPRTGGNLAEQNPRRINFSNQAEIMHQMMLCACGVAPSLNNKQAYKDPDTRRVIRRDVGEQKARWKCRSRWGGWWDEETKMHIQNRWGRWVRAGKICFVKIAK